MENNDSELLRYLYRHVVKFMVRYEVHHRNMSLETNKDCNTAYNQLIEALHIVAEHIY